MEASHLDRPGISARVRRALRPRNLALGGLLLVALAASGCAALFYGYLGYELYDRYINRDRGDRTTRIVYVVESSGLTNPHIVGARVELYALKTGGSPSNPADFETTADAVRETNEDGEALVYVKAETREAGDNIIQPALTYLEKITAPGFQPYQGVREAIDEDAGLVEADPILLVPK
jgi:hypothetical protein